jgi:hypothetical protein
MTPNMAAPVDAPVAPLFHVVRHWRRATGQRRQSPPSLAAAAVFEVVRARDVSRLVLAGGRRRIA